MEYNYSNLLKCCCWLNLIICVSSVFISVIFFSLCVIFSCLVVCPTIFDWMPDSVNFNFLSAWNFFMFLKFLSFVMGCIWFTWKQLNPLALAFMIFLGETRAVFSVWAIIHNWGKTVLCALPSAKGIMRVSSLACGNWYLPGLGPHTFFISYLFRWNLFWPQIVSHVPDKCNSAKYVVRGFSVDVWRSLSIKVLFSELCSEKTNFLGLPTLSDPTQRVCWTLPGLPLSVLWPGTSRQLAGTQSLPHSFLFSYWSLSFTDWYPLSLKNVVSYILFICFVCFNEESKSGSGNSILNWSKVFVISYLNFQYLSNLFSFLLNNLL